MNFIEAKQAADLVNDGDTIMIGGFMSNGTPEILMDALVAKNVRHLTVIANDTGTPGTGIAKLISAGMVDNLIASHIGLNPETGRLMSEGKLNVTLVPQGSLAEKIRAAGAGLGGVLTPTGLGTEVAEGKEVITIDGKDFLLEKPLKAKVAFLRGSVVDKMGNTVFKGTTPNFNTVMALAAETVVVAAAELVEIGEIPGEMIMTPGPVVDYVVEGEA